MNCQKKIKNGDFISSDESFSFSISQNTLTTASIIYVDSLSSLNDTFEISIYDSDHQVSFIETSGSNILYTSSVGKPSSIEFKHDSMTWQLNSKKRIFSQCFEKPLIDSMLPITATLDVDMCRIQSLSVSGSDLKFVKDVVSETYVDGIGHEPSWDRNGWNPNVPSFILSGGINWYDKCNQYILMSNQNDFFDVVTCNSISWSEWSVFLVFKLETTASYQGIWGLFQDESIVGPWPKVVVEADSSTMTLAVFDDRTSGGTINGSSSNLGVSDTNKHLLEISADGLGGINAWLDGTMVVSGASDYHPKSIGHMSMGSSWQSNPAGWRAPATAKYARFIAYNQNVSDVDRGYIRSYLKDRYGI